MKNWTLKVAMLVTAAMTLTACPDKKDGAAAPPPPANGTGVCTIGPDGQCVGATAFIGRGRWSGYLIVAPEQAALYQSFLMENGLCHGYRCQRMQQFVGVSMNVRNNEANVVITPWEFHRWSRNKLSRPGYTYLLNGGASFQIAVRDPNYYIQQPMQNQIVAPSSGAIQLVSTFNSQYGNSITTNLYYRGVVIATGQLSGFRYQQPVPYGQNPAPVLPYQ